MSQMIEKTKNFIEQYVTAMSFPSIKWTDIVEILIISYIIYRILVWIRDTKSWAVLKGILLIVLIVLFASVFDMTTILWLTDKFFTFAVTAVIVIFAPEIRKALDHLGRNSFFSSFFPFFNNRVVDELFSDDTIQEIIRAAYDMGRAKTGALIVIGQKDSLVDYERTGIELDAAVSSQLLINIFEHNTPLHDGAVIIKGDRITSATCYLPLSDNMELSKELGTRHRAGVGISEVTDSLTVIVSEETGRVSVAYESQLYRNLDSEELREKLQMIQNKTVDEKRKFFVKKKGGVKDEK